MPQPQLSHLVLLLPYRLLKSPPTWLTAHFSVTPVGTSPDNKTETSLIIFRDGTYIELIAFIDDLASNKVGHPYEHKKPGFVGFALSGRNDSPKNSLDRTKKNDGLVISYSTPQKVQRRMQKTCNGNRTETHEYHWFESRPKICGNEAECIPFFIHHDDISSPHSWKVPATIATTSHPSGALGLSYITISVPQSQLQEYLQAYHTLLGSRSSSSNTNLGIGVGWRVGVPLANVKGLAEKHEPLIYVEGNFGDGGITELALKTTGTGFGWTREMISERIQDGGEVNICFVHGSHTTGRF